MDLVLATIPVLVMGYTGPTDRLVPRPPTRRILTFLPAASIFSFLIFQTIIYWLLLLYLRVQPWYVYFFYVLFFFSEVADYWEESLYNG